MYETKEVKKIRNKLRLRVALAYHLQHFLQFAMPKVSIVDSVAQREYFECSANDYAFEPSVTRLGESAFSNSRIERVRAPPALETIGSNCFRGCYRLRELDLAAVVSKDVCLGDWAFAGCATLFVVKLPPNIARLNEALFYDCRSIVTLDLPDSILELGGHCFFECASLTTIRLPPHLRRLGFWCFKGCTSLRHVKLPSTLTHVGRSCFTGCTSLRTVDLGALKTVRELPMHAFAGCPIRSIVLPPCVNVVERACFANCRSLEAIDLSMVQVLGEGVFEGCTRLHSAIFGDRLQRIGPACFARTALRQALLPEGVAIIPSGSFSECVFLHHVRIPTSVHTIQAQAFQRCCRLGSVTLPAVGRIGPRCFERCTTLGRVDMRTCATLKNIPDFCFAGCFELHTVRLPTNVRSIDIGSFSRCVALRACLLPRGLRSVSVIAFKRCVALQHIGPKFDRDVEGMLLVLQRLERRRTDPAAAEARAALQVVRRRAIDLLHRDTGRLPDACEVATDAFYMTPLYDG